MEEWSQKKKRRKVRAGKKRTKDSCKKLFVRNIGWRGIAGCEDGTFVTRTGGVGTDQFGGKALKGRGGKKVQKTGPINTPP